MGMLVEGKYWQCCGARMSDHSDKPRRQPDCYRPDRSDFVDIPNLEQPMPKIIHEYKPAPGAPRVVADLPGEFLNMCVFRDRLIVLTSHGAFWMVDDKLARIPFEPETPLYYSSDDGTFQQR